MTQQEEIEALQAALRIEHANLQELARLVLALDAMDFYLEMKDEDVSSEELIESYEAMINFAKGVAQ